MHTNDLDISHILPQPSPFNEMMIIFQKASIDNRKNSTPLVIGGAKTMDEGGGNSIWIVQWSWSR